MLRFQFVKSVADWSIYLQYIEAERRSLVRCRDKPDISLESRVERGVNKLKKCGSVDLEVLEITKIALTPNLIARYHLAIMIARNIDSEMTDPSPRKDQSIKPSTKSPVPKHWYSIPDPVRRVFNHFPLVTYSENELPQRAKRRSNVHTLYVFDNTFDLRSDISCNPTCLKWQAYLKFRNIDFVSQASNNHASPSGALPFLLPATNSKELNPSPLTTGKIPRWTSQQNMQEEDTMNVQQEVYMSLVDQSIRNAWLYHLYLVQPNFDGVAHPLYVATTSSNHFVRSSVAHSLQQAARDELLKSRQIIDGGEIYAAAVKAFGALSTLLGSRDYFSAEGRPGLFDASVFAYTHLLLEGCLPWKDSTLSDILRQHPSLVEHQDRLLQSYVKS